MRRPGLHPCNSSTPGTFRIEQIEHQQPAFSASWNACFCHAFAKNVTDLRASRFGRRFLAFVSIRVVAPGLLAELERCLPFRFGQIYGLIAG